MRYDDGFVAYINGVEVARDRAPDDPVWNSNATGSHRDTEAVLFEPFSLDDHRDLLQPGENILAIHGMNQSTGGNDSLFFPIIVGGTELEPDTISSIQINEMARAEAATFFVEIKTADRTRSIARP